MKSFRNFREKKNGLSFPRLESLESRRLLSVNEAFDGMIGQESLDFYRSVYEPPGNVPAVWQGDVHTGQAGTIGPEYRQSILDRLNALRAMVGLSGVTFDPVLDAKAQKAAMLMSVNSELSHTPPQSWKFWSQDAYDAASTSNLFLGVGGPEAMTGYVMDPGDNNYFVGHRMWVFDTRATVMGIGDIPTWQPIPGMQNQYYYPANVLTVAVGPRTDYYRYVAWPPAGDVPRQAFESWDEVRFSFNMPITADVSQARISMTVDGQPAEFVIRHQGNAWLGGGALVWAMKSEPDWKLPHVIDVAIDGVMIEGQNQSFRYQTRTYDPDAPPVFPTVPAATGLKFETESIVVNEAEGKLDVTVLRTGDLSRPLDFCIVVSPYQMISFEDDKATFGEDFSFDPTWFRMEPGQDRWTYRIDIENDGNQESRERFDLSIRTANGFGVSTDVGRTATVRIQDNDTPVLDVNFASGSEIVLREGGIAVVTLERKTMIDSLLRVRIVPENLPGASTSWQKLIRSLDESGDIWFAPGSKRASLELRSIQDSVPRPETVFKLNIYSEDFDQLLDAATVRFIDDDSSNAGSSTVGFAEDSTQIRASESAGGVTLNLVRAGDTSKEAVIPLSIVQTAGPKIRLPKPADIRFRAGQTAISVFVKLPNDRDAKPNLEFSFRLGKPKTKGVNLDTFTTASVIVDEDDPLPIFNGVKGLRNRQNLTSLDALFTGSLNATLARNLNLWTVTESGADGLFGTTDDVLVALSGATYKSATKTVNLKLRTTSRSAVPLNYQVVLDSSGLKNAFGLPLTGTIVRNIRV